MNRVSPGALFRYWFDSLIARGPWVLVMWMLGAALAMVVVVASLARLLGVVPPADDGTALGFGELVWVVLMHAIDPGTITGDEGPADWRAMMMLATVAGILMIGGLVGIMVAGVGRLFENLRKGRSLVLERDHTLIVGWSRQVFTVVSELAAANESRRGGCVVVVADRDKVEMEDALRAKVPSTGRTRVIVRSGDPTDPGALAVGRPDTARAIVVLAPEGARDDTQAIRALLAVGRHPVAPGVRQHLVAEIRDPVNVGVARLTSERRLETLEVGELVAQLMVQTCLQSGLASVYEELLGFDGDEIYFHDEPALVGRSFGDALNTFADATLMGLRRADGQVLLNPPMDSVIEAGDVAIVIAEDEDRIHVAHETARVDETLIVGGPRTPTSKRRTLVLGWGPRARAIVLGIDAYVTEDSVIEVVSTDPHSMAEAEALAGSLRCARLSCRLGNPTDRALLDQLTETGLDHVLIVSDPRIEDAHEADARSIVTLLHLRDIAGRRGQTFSTVSEMRDIRSRDLARAARADDFVISDRLLGLLLAQVAENADLARVFDDLFDPEGAEIYLRPVVDYVRLDSELSFTTLVEAARRRNETAIGYRVGRLSSDAAHRFGIVLNPDRTRRLRMLPADRVIVLADG